MFDELIDEMMALSPECLDDALDAAVRDCRRAELRLAAVTAAIDVRGRHREHGHRSIKGFLKARMNCSGVEANRIRRRAALVNRHSDIGDALLSGRVGTEQVDRMARAAAHPRAGHRFAEFAPLLLDHAERLEFDDFDRAVAHFVITADEDGAFDDQRFHEDERRASVSVVNGAVDVHAVGGSPTSAAEIKEIFDRAVEAEFRKDCEVRRTRHGDDALAHPLPRTLQQRKFDALHEIFLASVTAPKNGLRPEPLVSFIVDVGTGIEALARHGFLDVDHESIVGADPAARRCATAAGSPVHPDVVMKAMLRGSVQRVVVDAHDVVINHGRRRRLFTGKAREAAQLLATTCGHRGCDVPASFCDVDHVDEWAADGGQTNQDNALPLCGTHDRWKHRHRLRGRRDRSGRIHLVTPDGTVIKPIGARDPVWADDPAPADDWRSLTMRDLTRLSEELERLPDPGWTTTVLEFPAA